MELLKGLQYEESKNRGRFEVLRHRQGARNRLVPLYLNSAGLLDVNSVSLLRIVDIIGPILGKEHRSTLPELVFNVQSLVFDPEVTIGILIENPGWGSVNIGKSETKISEYLVGTIQTPSDIVYDMLNFWKDIHRPQQLS